MKWACDDPWKKKQLVFFQGIKFPSLNTPTGPGRAIGCSKGKKYRVAMEGQKAASTEEAVPPHAVGEKLENLISAQTSKQQNTASVAFLFCFVCFWQWMGLCLQD